MIGTGLMGCEHIRNLTHVAAVEDINLRAVADPDAGSRDQARLACGDRFSPAFFEDYRALLSLDLDAVIIASPNFTHIDVVRDLAASPFHLLLEKPMCTTLEDCRELVAISQSRSPLTWIALEYRYMSATRAFLDQLPAVGELKRVFIREHRFPFLPKVGNWNRFNRNTGGTLVEKCCHFFDLMNLVTGAAPVRALASGGQDLNHLDERYDGETPDIIDNAYVIIEYDNGVRGCLDLCMYAEGSRNEQELQAVGSLAKLEVHIPENRLQLSPRQGDRIDRIIPHDPAIRFHGKEIAASYLELLDFIDAARTRRPPTVSAIDGFRSVAMGIAAQTAIATRTSVDIVQP
ncbi:MAG: Gfo/Idh/MocA family oxidoreductase [Proteobacteria bacterium]|nr:Gfo/Idh/MocA family oxidoreductase [Pseudomonadota bacterium]